jgi:hypothetical protein
LHRQALRSLFRRNAANASRIAVTNVIDARPSDCATP